MADDQASALPSCRGFPELGGLGTDPVHQRPLDNLPSKDEGIATEETKQATQLLLVAFVYVGF